MNKIMNRQEAMQIIKAAIEFKSKKLGDVEASKNVKNAAQILANQNKDWNSENAFAEFVEYASQAYLAWLDNISMVKPSGILVIDRNNKAELVARFVHRGVL